MQNQLKKTIVLLSVLFFNLTLIGCTQKKLQPPKKIYVTKYIYAKKRKIPILPHPKSYIIRDIELKNNKIIVQAYEFYNAQKAAEAKEKTIIKYENMLKKQ